MNLSSGLQKEGSLPKLEIGIGEAERMVLGQALAVLLADTYMLYIKTQNYHWNVTGPFFQSLHATFETQYQDLAQANDMLAERIRSLGFFAKASCSQFKLLSKVTESDGLLDATQMVADLISGNETVIRTARSLVTDASRAADHGTADLVTRRLEVHEKAVWMLRSLLNS